MQKRAPTIAGFGFSTGGARPDLSDLDVQLARFEATGASHVELSLFEFDLIVGGRVLPEPRRRLERICSARALRYTVHGALGINFMDEERLDRLIERLEAHLDGLRVAGADGRSIAQERFEEFPEAGELFVMRMLEAENAPRIRDLDLGKVRRYIDATLGG